MSEELKKPENHPVKLTITYGDGHTTGHDIFIAFMPDGLVPCGREGDNITYMAPEEGFKNIIVSMLSVDLPVVASLITSLTDFIKDMMDDMDPETMVELFNLMNTIHSNQTTIYKDAKIVRRNIGEN